MVSKMDRGTKLITEILSYYYWRVHQEICRGAWNLTGNSNLDAWGHQMHKHFQEKQHLSKHLTPLNEGKGCAWTLNFLL